MANSIMPFKTIAGIALIAVIAVVAATGAGLAQSPSVESINVIRGNLLFNPSFNVGSETGLPDYWDVHHAAHITLPECHDYFSIDGSVRGPISNVGVLRIRNPSANFNHLILATVRFRFRVSRLARIHFQSFSGRIAQA